MSISKNFNEKQIQILQVAETFFAENGYEGTSIRTIAKEAKINVAMVSYYFGSKEKLLEALIIYRTSDLKIQIENLSHEDIDPIEKIDKLIELYINRIQCNKGIYRILHFEFSTENNEDRLKALNEVRDRNLKSIEAIIHEGQEKGIFRKDIIIALIPPTIMGTYFHFNMNKAYFKTLLALESDEQFHHYTQTTFKTHIQQTIKALLIYEN